MHAVEGLKVNFPAYSEAGVLDPGSATSGKTGRQMNWDAIGSIGEIIGAAAVVISLLYLAMQIRTQNAEARLKALHEMGREQRIASELLATRELADIFVRANQDYSSITEVESVQLVVVITGLFRAWERAFLEHRDGNLDDEVWASLTRDYIQPMGAPSFRHIWSIRKQNYNKDFCRYIDSIDLGEYISK